MTEKPDTDNPWGGVSTGWQVTSYMLAAIGVWTGIGYLIDRLAGTPKIFMAVGTVVGAAAGTYLIYLRYGKTDDTKRP